MREYELTIVYDLALAEAGGADAAVQHLGAAVEARGGKLLKTDHWGRRRLAYPIGTAIDADYVVSRVELDPPAIAPLEQALRIDERVYRHLIVRADELPAPPPPREPRRMPEQAPAEEAAQTPDAPAEATAERAATEAAAPEVGATEPDAGTPVVSGVESEPVAEQSAATEATQAAPEAEPETPPDAAQADDTASAAPTA